MSVCHRSYFLCLHRLHRNLHHQISCRCLEKCSDRDFSHLPSRNFAHLYNSMGPLMSSLFFIRTTKTMKMININIAHILELIVIHLFILKIPSERLCFFEGGFKFPSCSITTGPLMLDSTRIASLELSKYFVKKR